MLKHYTVEPTEQTRPIEVIPAVDVLGGRVVRLHQGDYRQVTEYGRDPVVTAQEWMTQGARLVHVVDLDGARNGTTDLHLWRRLGDAGIAFQAGGGIRTEEVATAVLGCGAQRVVMGTAAVWDPLVLSAFGSSVVAAVDVKGGRATGAGWLDGGRDLSPVLDGLAEAGVGRLLVTGIDRDGTMGGVDVALTRAVLADARFAVIASGGVAEPADVWALARLGCEAVVVGRALYEGRFTLAEAIDRSQAG